MRAHAAALFLDHDGALAMKTIFKTLQALSLSTLAALSLGAVAGETFTMNGRVMQLEPAGKAPDKAKASTASDAASASAAKVKVRDLASGQISVYAEGLIVTLKNAETLKSLLQDYPALTLQYAPGNYVYVKVARDQLATTFDALSADARVAAVHLRPVPVQIKPR